MSRKSWAQALVLSAVIVASMVVGGVLAVNLAGDDGTPAATVATESPSSSLPVAQVVAPTVAPTPSAGAAVTAELPDMVEEVRRSVVGITSITLGAEPGPFGQRNFRSEGEGTGIVVDRDGHILTNYHVIEGADEIIVQLWDGSVAVARVVGADKDNDLAVLEASFQPQLLAPARFGDSDSVRVGETVIAIGNPFSFDFSVTRGIVSGLGRESGTNSSGRPIRNVIQIDAAVNPGNSGGPLFNMAGEVIGINTAIHNPTQQRVFVGVGLAVPSNTAVRFLPDMIAGNDIQHAQLGIGGMTLTALNARDVRVEVDRGVYVTAVSNGSAADRAGLRGSEVGGDVIIAIDGVEVLTFEGLARIVDGRDVSDEITLTVMRGDTELQLSATLQPWPGR